MKIALNTPTQTHILKHFYFLDNEYIDNSEIENIHSYLKINSSKFFKFFAQNPHELIDKIEAKLDFQNLQEGKNEITILFDELIGFDLLIDKELQNNEYTTSRELNIILTKENDKLNIITIFPGKFAPALPDRKHQSLEEYSTSEMFWNQYHLSLFNSFESTEGKIKSIVDKVEESWNRRYTDAVLVLQLVEESKKEAQKIAFIEGETLVDFVILSSQLMKSSAQEETFEELNRLLSEFDRFKNKKFSVRTLITLANQYDLLGMYSKGIQACVEGIVIAKENHFLPELSDLQSTFGFINIRISDFEQAEASFKESLKIRKELGDLPAIAASYNQLARASMLNKKYKDAEAYYLESIKIRQENKFYGALLWSYIGISSLYMEIKDYDKTLHYFKEIDLLKVKYGLNDQRSSIMCLQGEGQIKNNLKEFKQAQKPLHEALQIAEEINIKPIQYQVHLELYKSYRNLHQEEKALYHFEQYHKIKEAVLDQENANKLKQMQISFAVEKSEKEAEIERLKNVELKKANDEITRQKEEIEDIHKEISDSINYAQKIQETVLPTVHILEDNLSDYFVLFKPKDKVSGDFYWWTHTADHTVITAADCTGHGVPGAFMSMLGVSFLREIVIKERITNTGEILSRLRTQIIKALKQTGESGTQKDGMDMAIISINHKSGTVQFSGANNPLYLILNSKLQILNEESNSAIKLCDNSKLKIQNSKLLYEVKPDKMPIAIYEKMDAFTAHEIQLQKGDQLYMFSDGFADQFGGPKGKKFKYKPFKRLLLENVHKPMTEQKEILNQAFENWRGKEEQIDDVVVLGIKI